MQENCITIQLRLPGVKVLDVKEDRHWIEVLGQYRTEEAECPRCGRSTWQVHQWHLQQKRDARLWKKAVYLALLKRRFRCRHCRKVIMEPDPVCERRLGGVWTGIGDLETATPVAVVPGERQVDVQRMLERHGSRDTVRAVAIDLSEPYRQAVELVLPDALIEAGKVSPAALACRALSP